jgi:hypothetical protein
LLAGGVIVMLWNIWTSLSWTVAVICELQFQGSVIRLEYPLRPVRSHEQDMTAYYRTRGLFNRDLLIQGDVWAAGNS